MSKNLLYKIPSIFFLLVLSLSAQTAGNLTVERWNNLPASSSVLELQKEGIAKRAPDSTSLNPGAEWLPGQGNNYGVRLRGTVTAPVTGSYTFFVAGDDNAELFLSSDTSRFNKQRIAWVHAWTGAKQWDKYSTQRSKAVYLTAGQKYYIEAQMKESGGGDHLSVGWSYETPVTLQENAVGDNVTQTWTETNGVHTLDVEAGDIWGTADRFAFKHRTWTGDGDFIARVSAMNNPYRWAKVGLMVRASLDADSAHASMFRTGAKGMAFQRRQQAAAGSLGTTNPDTYEWVKLTRRGDVIAGYISADGKGWLKVGQDTLTGLPAAVYVGVAATDNAGSNHVLATVENIDYCPVTASEVIPSVQLESITTDANDTDDDNLPDDWETQHGLDPAIALGDDGEYGDHDNDGISNFDEYTLGSHPTQQDVLLDGLTRERWCAIGGGSVTDLTSNRGRFLRQPSEIIHVSNIDEFNVGDYYASRYRGAVTAPVTGDYTFWMAGDDEAELWISDGTVVKDVNGASTALTNRYGKQKLAWIQDQRFGKDFTGDEDFDLYATQRSKTVHLTAGQHYYLEILHKESYSNDHIAVAWQVPGGQREIIPPSAFSGDTPEGDDADDDYLPSAWETQYGLNPADNGLTDSRDGQYGDWDQDGLTNFEEYQLGSDPTNADTDGDSLTDKEERDYYGTDPLVSNQLSPSLHTAMQLTQYVDSTSAWHENADGHFVSSERRGVIGYGFTVDPGEEGIYEISITAGADGVVRSTETLPLSLALNDNAVGQLTIVSLDGAAETGTRLTPWLAAGDYTLTITNTNYRAALRLRLEDVKVTHLGGMDANSNGIADWMEDKIANENRLTYAPPTSAVSPLCIEAVTPHLSLASLSKTVLDPQSGLPVQQTQPWIEGINEGAYSNVELNSSGATEITASFQSGAVVDTRQITWVATNLLTTDTIDIRKGDSLKLTAHDGTKTGTFTMNLALNPLVSETVPSEFQGYLPTSAGSAAIAWTDRNVNLIAGATATLNGSWLGGQPRAATAYHVEVSGNTATFQLQYANNNYTKVVKVELQQEGLNIKAHQIYARYKAGNHLGADFDTISHGSAPIGSGGYGVTDINLSVYPAAPGIIDLTPSGSLTASQDIVQLFAYPGTHTMTATWTPADGSPAQTSTLAVNVLEADFGEGIDVMAWNRRTWTVPGVGSNLIVEADDALAWNETTEAGDESRSFTVDTYEAGTRHTLARLPGGGAILARGDVRGFYIASVDETSDATMVTQLPDGTYLMRMTYVAENLPANARIRIRSYYQGTTFLNGGNELDLTSADFDENGIAYVYMEWADGTSSPSMCHYIDVFLD